MKKGKKGILILLEALLVFFVCVLGLSLNARALLVGTIGTSGIDTAISHRMMDAVFQEAETKDSDWLLGIQNDIEDSKAVGRITGKLLDEMTRCIKEGTAFEGVDLSEELNRVTEEAVAYVKQSDPSLGEARLNQLKEELLKMKPEIESVINGYADGIFHDLNDTTGLRNQMVKIYAVAEANWFRCVLAIISIVLIVLTCKLSSSASQALLYLGVDSLVVSAVFSFLINAVGNKIMMLISNRFLGRTMMLESQPLIATGVLFFVMGLVLILFGITLGRSARRKNQSALQK